MKRSERLAALLFRAVCLGFSALMLVLSLFWHIRLVRCEARLAVLNAAVAAAENERVLLETELAAQVSLEALERYAVQTLGMQHPTQGQIIRIEPAG